MSERRIADYVGRIGRLPCGQGNRITDVPGVLVGHTTLIADRCRTGVTVILPGEGNPFVMKPVAASFVQNGFGKTAGLIQIDELGTLETPIALTNTLNVGLVSDALVEYMIDRCAGEGIPLRSVNPVVGECNDARLNDILLRAVRKEHVFSAIAHAAADFEQGDVGAGAGTICHGLKGGIGSASRVIDMGGQAYTLGVLVQSNHGSLRCLTVRGEQVGERIVKAKQREAEEPLDKGSIMMVLATDLPVSDRQLRRIIKRCGVGLARVGSYFGHGSGDVMIGFSTANRMPHGGMDRVLSFNVVTEFTLERAFEAAAEATEEAVLNSMVAADGCCALDGERIDSLADWL